MLDEEEASLNLKHDAHRKIYEGSLAFCIISSSSMPLAGLESSTPASRDLCQGIQLILMLIFIPSKFKYLI